MATTALILHRVSDYDAWRTVYDSADGIRERGGVTGAEVLKPTNDEGLVAVRTSLRRPKQLPPSSRTRS